MKLVLDTNAYSYSARGDEAPLTALERAEELYIPAIVYGELYYGFQCGARLGANLDQLDKFIDEFGVKLIDVDREVARFFGEIFASLRKKGRPIPTNDIWISACCMSVGGTLLTFDEHFRHVSQIRAEILSPRS